MHHLQARDYGLINFMQFEKLVLFDKINGEVVTSFRWAAITQINVKTVQTQKMPLKQKTLFG